MKYIRTATVSFRNSFKNTRLCVSSALEHRHLRYHDFMDKDLRFSPVPSWVSCNIQLGSEALEGAWHKPLAAGSFLCLQNLPHLCAYLSISCLHPFVIMYSVILGTSPKQHQAWTCSMFAYSSLSPSTSTRPNEKEQWKRHCESHGWLILEFSDSPTVEISATSPRDFQLERLRST